MGELHVHGIAAVVFVAYPLPLSRFLHRSFAVGLPLQTASPLISLLMIHGILDGFAVDGYMSGFAFNASNIYS